MIEVTIGGCESSYFAGEQIELTVTFTNTNTRPSSNSTAPASPNPPRSAPIHRRGTHSISSAPLPRPPTSPGIHQSFQTHHRPSLSASSDSPRTRRGLIGLPSAPVYSLRPVQRNTPVSAHISHAKRLASSRSLSVNLSLSQLEVVSSNSRAPSPATPDACAYVRPSFRPLNAR
jgi:RAB6A-GEF complex partner protein 2